MAAQDARRHLTKLLLVFDDQDHFGSTQRGKGPRFLFHRLGTFNPRQVDFKAGPMARLAVYPDRSAALFDDAIHGGESQAGSFTLLLGGEERLE